LTQRGASSSVAAEDARLILLAPFVAAGARAAEVTDMAPEMGILGGLTYTGSALNGTLVEDDTTIAERRVSRHDLNLAVEFSPAERVAITLAVPITLLWRFSFPEARTMVVDPITGTGTYLADDTTAEATAITAAGLQGVWLGAAVAPFSEQYAASDTITWRLDGAIRTPSAKRNLWTAPSGRRGAAPGGWGFRLAGAFSTDLGAGEPYLTAEYLRESKVSVDVVEDGVTWATDLPLHPASVLGATGGVEIVALDRPDTGTRFAVDLSLGAAYRTWEDIATGVYLPNVLDSARSIPVTAGDSVSGTVGVALDLHVDAHVRLRSGATLEVRTPYRPEHLYEVRTATDTYVIGWTFEVTGVASFAPDQN